MNNICIFIPTLQSGGAEKQAVLLSKVLYDDYHTFLVIWKGNLTEQKFIDYIDKNQINAVYLTGNLLVRFYKLVKFLKEKKINIIFGYLASNNFYGSIAGKISGVDYIVGGIRNAEIPRVKLIIQRFLHNHILTYTIFNNYSGKEKMVKYGFKTATSHVIPNCFELEILPQTRSLKKEITIISLARFVEQKDYPTAIRAIACLANKVKINPAFRFKYQIIGYGALEQNIRRLVSEANLDNYIEIIINPPNITDYLEYADIFLTTSLFEGTSNSIMEAMSFSLPVVATDAGDNNQLVEENISGFICKIGDHTLIAERLFSLLTDFEKRIEFGNAGYLKLKNNFSTDIFKARYIEFITQLKNKDQNRKNNF